MTVLGFGATGLQVEHLQAALKVKVDGDFGPKTHDALCLWQSVQKLPETGECSETEWKTLTGRPQPSAFDRCLAVTSSIEGHGWANPKILPDGAGITAGIIGFTTGSGSLKRVVAMAGGSPSLIALPGPGDLPADQKQALSAFLVTPAAKVAQVQVARDIYWGIAVQMAVRWHFIGFPWYLGLCFDIAVQNGGLAGTFADQGSVEDRAEAVVAALLRRVKTEWRENVKARKQLFLRGAGTVHGRHYRLPAYGLHSNDALRLE